MSIDINVLGDYYSVMGKKLYCKEFEQWCGNWLQRIVMILCVVRNLKLLRHQGG